MRKFITLLLSVVLIIPLCASVYADDEIQTDKPINQEQESDNQNENIFDNENISQLSKDAKDIEKSAVFSLSNGTNLADWEWEYSHDRSEIILNKYIGTSTDVVVPGQFDGETASVTLYGKLYTFPTNITSIVINDLDHPVKLHTGFHLFDGCEELVLADLTGLDTYGCTLMDSMFEGCIALETLDISNFVTSNVTSMQGMFCDCASLKTLDLSHFDTGNVEWMDNMFAWCVSLTSVDVSSFDTRNVTQISSMFSQCSSLKSLDLSHFRTERVSNMALMFENCSSLTSLDISHFDTSQVVDMYAMFDGCQSLQSLDITNFNVSQVTEGMFCMFRNCISLTSLKIGNFDASNAMDYRYMFFNCVNLKDIDLSGMIMNPDAENDGMFTNCKKIKSASFVKMNTNQNEISSLFVNLSNVHYFDLRYINTDDITPYSYGNGFAVFRSLEEAQYFMKSYDYDDTEYLINKEDFYDETIPTEGVPTLILMTKNETNLSRFEDPEVWKQAVLEEIFKVSSEDELDETQKLQMKMYYEYPFLNRTSAGPIYDANGGTFNDGTVQKKYFDSIIVHDESLLFASKDSIAKKYTPSFKGKAFAGWYLDPECTQKFSGKEIVDLSSDEYISLHLYACWKEAAIQAEDKTIYVGDSFDLLQGVLAQDAFGNDISNRIIVKENNVDSKKVGQYTVTYEVTDDYGSSVIKTITVTVLENQNHQNGNQNQTHIQVENINQSGNVDQTKKVNQSNIQTGDMSQIEMFVTMLFFSIIVFIVLKKMKSKLKKD